MEMNELETKLLEASAPIWEKEKIKRIYLNDDLIVKVFGFKLVETPKFLEEFKSIGKAKVWFDLNKKTFHADVGLVRVMFNSNKITCKK